MGSSMRQLLKGTKRLPAPEGLTMRTVQAPHSPSAQPSLEPVRRWERMKSRRVVEGGTPWACTSRPFKRKWIGDCALSSFTIGAFSEDDSGSRRSAASGTRFDQMLAFAASRRKGRGGLGLLVGGL